MLVSHIYIVHHILHLLYLEQIICIITALAEIKNPLHNIIRNSYLGGVNRIFKSIEILYCYDVNSLYPFSMLKDLPGKYLGYKRNDRRSS